MDIVRPTPVLVGTAAWSMRADPDAADKPRASMLTRYARLFDVAEVNSTFYRLPRSTTIERWTRETPETFRFSVKLPRAISHAKHLGAEPERLDEFIRLTRHFGSRLGPLLVQLPPRLALVPEDAETFFARLRAQFAGAIACEPRHASWFSPDAEALLARYSIAGVDADPAPYQWSAPAMLQEKLLYIRLHGSPKIYYSAYDTAFIERLATRLAAHGHGEIWCIFDNTASGAALDNAVALSHLLGKLPEQGHAHLAPCRAAGTRGLPPGTKDATKSRG